MTSAAVATDEPEMTGVAGGPLLAQAPGTMRYLTTLLTATLLFTSVAHADIGARTEVVLKRGYTPVDDNGYYKSSPTFLLGRELEASYGEAFVGGVTMVYKAYSAYSGAKLMISLPAGTTGADLVDRAWDLLREGRVVDASSLATAPLFPLAARDFFVSVADFIHAFHDRFAQDTRTLRVRKTANYDKVVLSFKVWSDDDPFGTLTAKPLYQQPGIHVSGPYVTQWAWAEHRYWPKKAEVRVTVDTSVVPVGVHPITFFAKETDCHECLGISHTVMVSVAGVCSGRSPSCTIYDSWINWYQVQIDNARADMHTLLASDDAGVHTAISAWKRQQDICQHRGAPGSYGYDSCVDTADGVAWSDYCPDVAFGSRTSACSRLRDLERYISWAQGEISRWQRASHGLGCDCPAGGSTNAY